MREIWISEGLHVGHAVRPPYPTKYELGVVFWYAFVRVSTPNGARPPLPINIKGNGRLKGYHNRIYPCRIYPFPLLFQPHVYSSTTSAAWEDILASLPSLGQPKVRLTRRGPSRVGVRWFLAGEPGDPGLTTPDVVWPPYVEALQGALHVLVGSEKVSTVVSLLCMILRNVLHSYVWCSTLFIFPLIFKCC
jgi:hypothetical protein